MLLGKGDTSIDFISHALAKCQIFHYIIANNCLWNGLVYSTLTLLSMLANYVVVCYNGVKRTAWTQVMLGICG